MNTDPRKKEKKYFEKDLFKLMNNTVFGKTMEKSEYSEKGKLCYIDTDIYKNRWYL